MRSLICLFLLCLPVTLWADESFEFQVGVEYAKPEGTSLAMNIAVRSPLVRSVPQFFVSMEAGFEPGNAKVTMGSANSWRVEAMWLRRPRIGWPRNTSSRRRFLM